MAYTAGGLSLVSSVNGFGLYRYDSLDDVDLVEDSNYFNNVDDSLNLAVGDFIFALDWTTAVRSGTVNAVKAFVVTNVIANDAASSAGNVNLAEMLISTDGLISSGD